MRLVREDLRRGATFCLFTGLLVVSFTAHPGTTCPLANPDDCGGYTAWATISKIEYVNGGLLVFGAFGNINGCQQANMIFIPQVVTDPESFRVKSSMMFVAMSAGHEVRFYTKLCTSVGFHYSGDDAANIAHTSATYIRL
ncbi:MAG: hypothetical protein AAF525_05475 [Pseudomonadota bacterium]